MEINKNNSGVRNGIAFLSFVLIVYSFCSCRKSELLFPDTGIRNLKVFDDTTASAENPSLKIAAGNNQLFMVYGNGAPSILVGGAIFTLDHRAKIISTDLNGSLLWQHELDYNLDIGDVVALQDGGCILAAYDYWGTTDHDQQHIYLTRFDAGGNKTLSDSITLPASLSTNYFLYPMGCCRAVNGNIILFGTIYDANDPVNSTKPYVGEYNLSGGWNWIKWYKFLSNASNESTTITSGVATNDGYLFTAIANEYAPGSSSSALIFKTNFSGDSTWSMKQQATKDAWVGNSAVSYNGEIYFAYSLGDDGSSQNDIDYTGFISHLDANGILLNSITVDAQSDNYITSISASGNGSVFALSNKFGNTLFSYGDPIFTGEQTHYTRTGATLNRTGQGLLQTETNDLFPVACKLPDGRTACFGLLQTKSRTYYKPALMILE